MHFSYISLKSIIQLLIMIPVQIRLTKRIVEEIDKIVDSGFHCNRSELIRDAIRRHLEFHSSD